MVKNVSLIFIFLILFSCNGKESKMKSRKENSINHNSLKPQDTLIAHKTVNNITERPNSPHKIYKNEFFSINSDRDGIIEVTLNKINKKLTNTKVLEGNANCPDISLDNIALKNNYFTIEKYNCTDKFYLKEYITFKFDKDLLLHKYSIELTDRHDPDKSIPNKNYTSKDFGNVKFENVDREFLINLLNK